MLARKKARGERGREGDAEGEKRKGGVGRGAGG